jgi:hypothetical protein
MKEHFCPVRMLVMIFNRQILPTDNDVKEAICIKENCEWWIKYTDDTKSCCAIKSIANDMPEKEHYRTV